MKLDRRDWLRAALALVTGVGAILSGIVIWRLRDSPPGARPCPVTLGRGSNELSSANIVVNARTHVLHHTSACRHPLPRDINRVKKPSDLPDVGVHRTHEASVFEALAGDAFANTRDDEAISHLKRGLAISPLRFHLYDRLVRVYGRRKQYDEIFKELQAGLREAERLASSNAITRTDLQRARQEFEARLAGAAARRSRAQQRSQKKSA